MKVVGLAMLKPQDVVVLLKIHTLSGRAWTFEKLGKSLLMQPSQVHSSLKRAEYADLYFSKSRSIRPHGLLEFLEHGIRYAFATKPGEVTRGIPTAHSSTPLNQHIVSSKGWAYVWPWAAGDIEGLTIEPLHHSVPEVAISDPTFHEYMSLIDALRVGRSRERELAGRVLKERFRVHYLNICY
jgi:hypothetical protein